MRIIAILASFLLHHSYCKEYTVEACSLSLEKMSKSSEKVKKRCADAYKWSDDEVELLLTVTKEYKTKQFAKSTVFVKKKFAFSQISRCVWTGHIVVSVVSVVRKKFIGQIEFILSPTTSCICRFFCIEHLYGRFR